MADTKTIYLSKTYSVQYKFRTSGATYTSSSSSSEFGVQYINQDTDGYFTRYIKLLIFTPSNFTKFASDNVVVKSITIKPFTVVAKSGNTYTQNFNINALSEDMGTSAESRFEAARFALGDSANKIGIFQPNITGSYQYSPLKITNETIIYNIIHYGFAIGRTTTGMDDNLAMYYIQSIASGFLEAEIEYYSSQSAPNVIITKPPHDITANYVIPMTESYDLIWEYIHPLGVPQSGFEIITRFSPFDENDYVSLTGIIDGADTEYLLTPEKYPDLPADTYVKLSAIWVRAYTTNNTISSSLDVSDEYGNRWVQFTFPQPYDLKPNDYSYVMADETISLTWKIKYSDRSGNEITASVLPTNFDIEFSSNGGETWNILLSNGIIEHDADNTYKFDIPKDTLPAGIIKYRIRAYAGGKTINTYETGYLTVRVNASTSSITCDGKPMPTLSWQSSAQVAYQVRFSDYDSGAVYGTETSYTVPYFYADGKYPVQVRTQASNGEWSEWTETEYVTITNSPTENQIGLTVTPTRHAVLAEWTDSGESDNYILYRSGIPIYIGQNKSYTDIAANGRCTYFVRAVTGKYYAPSNTVIIEAYPRVDCLYDFAGETWIPLKHSLSPRSRAYSKNVNIVYNHYAGRAKPVAFTSGYSTRQMSGDYVFKNREEALKISDLSGKRVIFKDTRGGIIVGILNSVNINVESRLYPVTFMITETDYKEAVEYADT